MTISVSDVLKTGNLDSIKNLGIEQVEKLWNTLQIKGMNGSNETERDMKMKCIEVLEVLYRKPWDETIFFKIIQMKLDICEERGCRHNELTEIKKLFSEFEMNCQFLPKIHLKRALDLKGEFVVLKLNDGLINRKPDLDRIITELVGVLVEYKKKGVSINVIGSKILEMMRSNIELSFKCGKQLESLIPECEEFKDFQVDLLNILTELTLKNAMNCKKNLDFSMFTTEAINLNVKSLRLKANVMGYFEFLKLTKLQDPCDFTQAIETCLATLKNRIAPSEDIRGKLQIIRFIVNEGEGKSLKMGIEFAIELFSNVDFNTTLILDELLSLIEENPATNHVGDLQSEMESLLMKFLDQIRLNKKVQRGVLETLLRLAEKNSTVKENYSRCEAILKVIKVLNFGFDDGLNFKLIKCYLKLDRLSEAKSTLEEIESINDGFSDTFSLLKLEAALRSQDDFTAFEMIEKLSKDSRIRAEHFLILFNELNIRLNSEMKMKLLKSAQDRGDSSFTIDIMRGIVSLVYDGVIESGLTTEYKQELESCFIKMIGLNDDQTIWLCQVCWNLGVIHARAEDFISAQFGFKWCQKFSHNSDGAKSEFGYKAGFYYLTAKVCGTEVINEEDYEIFEECELMNKSVALLCLKIEMLLRSRNWCELTEVLSKNDNLKFESLAEIVLRASEEIPLEIYRLIIEKLTENEFESQDFDIIRFSGLYRGLTTCALLQYPSDLGHFHTAVKMIKSSFGGYPSDETVWLCITALEMGRQASENEGEWGRAGEWTEMAMNLVYLLPTETEEDRILRNSLQESVQKLFERVVNRN